MQQPEIVRFGPYTFEPHSAQLRRGTRVLRAAPGALQEPWARRDRWWSTEEGAAGGRRKRPFILLIRRLVMGRKASERQHLEQVKMAGRSPHA